MKLEGPAADQHDQGLPWFSSVLKQILGWYQKSMLHCVFLMQLSPELTSKFSPKHSPPYAIKIVIMLPSQNKIQPKFSTSAL
jgi:hypothetical protein